MLKFLNRFHSCHVLTQTKLDSSIIPEPKWVMYSFSMIMIPRIPRIPKFFMGSALVRHPIRIPIRGCLLRIRSTSCRMLRLHHGAMQLEMMEIFNLQWMSILQLESGSYRSIYRFIIWYNDLYVQVVFRIIQISKNITSRDTPNPHI